ncbi:hypothetical protein HKD37_06G015377 [Glycine soja]|uniref:Uncharacterized protein n=1 Tax=Glycine soja TaxID=3848 RepID=A0A445K7E0_GLYSO|nr:hypothetical protein JHK87_014777 [Glycine soja]KAH1125095.1 hypothetical protein GYH30_014624 [Glycine max]KHN08966.1 hypothetical protein glysoja_021788 [Glycine soja]RZC06721.1 hypothetical protein D0Y65_014260 [Glycine soja]
MNNENSKATLNGVPPQPKPPDGEGSGGARVSFQDKVMEGSVAVPRMARTDLIANKLLRIELEDGDRWLPRCYIEDQLLEELRKPWTDALIMKLLGKRLSLFVTRESKRGVHLYEERV